MSAGFWIQRAGLRTPPLASRDSTGTAAARRLKRVAAAQRDLTAAGTAFSEASFSVPPLAAGRPDQSGGGWAKQKVTDLAALVDLGACGLSKDSPSSPSSSHTCQPPRNGASANSAPSAASSVATPGSRPASNPPDNVAALAKSHLTLGDAMNSY